MKIGTGQLNDIDYKACWKREYFEIVNGDGWAFHVVCGMPVSFCALSQEFRVHRHNFFVVLTWIHVAGLYHTRDKIPDMLSGLHNMMCVSCRKR